MVKKYLSLFSLLSLLFSQASPAYAQSAAPGMFGVREVVVDYVRFDDPKAADTCGLSREQVASVLAKALAGSGVPSVAVIDAKPPSSDIARIHLIPEISSHADESLGCVSWVSLSAESHGNVLVPPIGILRSVTVLYWRQHAAVDSGQSIHEQKIDEALQKMAAQLVQQYRLDQPPELSQ